MQKFTLAVILAVLFYSFPMPSPVSNLTGLLPAKAASKNPVIVASYSIQASLDVQAKTIRARETITYTNTSLVPIPDLVFHLYLNAFKDQNSIFLKESQGLSRGYGWDPQYPGWIDVSTLRIVNGPALQLALLEDGTLARASLPSALAPGQTLHLEVEFNELLPKVFARTGFVDDFFLVGQWFPKLGVWENGAWNAYPFHANSEFFADFGNYDVVITLPKEYVTGGVGQPVSQKDNGDGTQTISYHAGGVIDFAWTACPRFQSASRRVGPVDLVYLYLPEHDWSVKRALDAAQAALTHFGDWYGSFPYARLTVVDVPDNGLGAGGMEYPTFITSGTESITGLGPEPTKVGLDRSLELVVIHEAGHQWWQSTVAFNEAEEPWLDEGFTDYSTSRLAQELYPDENSAFQISNYRASYLDTRRFEYVNDPAVPMYGKAWDFKTIQYGIAAYSKPVLSLTTLERVLGSRIMMKLMSAFYQHYQFAHPTTKDFRSTVQQITGQYHAWFFDGLVYGSGVLDYSVKSVNDQSVTVERKGSLIIPTEVLVTFTNGTTQLETWDGSQAEKTFEFPNRPSVTSAQVDPQQKLLVDLEWSDNGLRRRLDLNSWLAVMVRILYQMENMWMSLGGL